MYVAGPPELPHDLTDPLFVSESGVNYEALGTSRESLGVRGAVCPVRSIDIGSLALVQQAWQPRGRLTFKPILFPISNNLTRICGLAQSTANSPNICSGPVRRPNPGGSALFPCS